MGPAWYVRQLLTGNGSIQSIWNRSPSANGNTFKVASVRSQGFVSRLDPENALVRLLPLARDARRRHAPTSVQSGALGKVSTRLAGPPPVPTLANAALKFGTLSLGTLPDRRDVDRGHDPGLGRQRLDDPGRRAGRAALGPDPPRRATDA